jgi:S-methylmethionine-dependent homocysteine/selenocysteine methylase
MESPELVQQAHESFASAGSDILTTSNYAVVPFHIGMERFEAYGATLTALAGQLARNAAAKYGCMVAGSLPPLFGSYRPDLFKPEQAPSLLEVIASALRPHVDFWLAETVSSIGEVRMTAEILAGDDLPRWFSFTLQDGIEAGKQEPRLRSRERVDDAVESAVEAGAAAVLFNCSQPEVMSAAVRAATSTLDSLGADLAVGVYANAFPPLPEDTQADSTLQKIREDLDPSGYLSFAEQWSRLGASIIGGCCGIGPEHIAALAKRFHGR